MQLPRLWVDGNEVCVHEVFMCFQVDPFPGGHMFRWHIPIIFIPNEIVSYATFEDAVHPPEDIARDWFFWLGSVLGAWNQAIESESGHGLRFVLNTIDEIKSVDDELRVSGRCSPFVHLTKGAGKGDRSNC